MCQGVSILLSKYITIYSSCIGLKCSYESTITWRKVATTDALWAWYKWLHAFTVVDWGYSRSIVRGKELVNVSLDDAGLARPRVPKHKQLVEILPFASWSLHGHMTHASKTCWGSWRCINSTLKVLIFFRFLYCTPHGVDYRSISRSIPSAVTWFHHVIHDCCTCTCA